MISKRLYSHNKSNGQLNPVRALNCQPCPPYCFRGNTAWLTLTFDLSEEMPTWTYSIQYTSRYGNVRIIKAPGAKT